MSSAGGDISFSAAVAAFGLLPRRSEDAGNLTFALVRQIAQGGSGEDPHGDRKEFMRLLERAERLSR